MAGCPLSFKGMVAGTAEGSVCGSGSCCGAESCTDSVGLGFEVVRFFDPGAEATRRAPSCRSTMKERKESRRGPRPAPNLESGRVRDPRRTWGVSHWADSPTASRSSAGRSLREPGRFSRAHEGVAYGCCVPALTRFTNPHCPGPPRLTQTPATEADSGQSFHCPGSRKWVKTKMGKSTVVHQMQVYAGI